MVALNGKFREYRLDNGLYVALQETPTKTIAGRLRVKYGSLHEREGEEGLAHFLEHTLMTGGTKKYSPEQTDRIRGNLGYINAFTGLDRTFIPMDILPEDIDQYLDFVSDAAFNPRFDSARIEQERRIVLREIADEKSAPSFKDNQEYQKALLGGYPSTYFVLGEESVVEGAKLEDLKRFHSRGYNANNMDLILVGNLPRNIKAQIEKYFGDKPTGENTAFQFPLAKDLEQRAVFHRPAPELYNADNSQASSAQITLGFLVPPETSEDYAALQILSIILGGDANSRLFQSIRQKKGLAYGIQSDYDGSFNRGMMHVSAGVPSVKQNESIDAIFEEMARLKRKPVTAREINRIRKSGRYGIAKHFETNEGHVFSIERKKDVGITPEIVMHNWNKVTPKKLQEVAQRYLPKRDGKYVLMIRDPLKA